MSVMNMGNTVPRAWLEPTSLIFWTSVLPLHHIGSLISPLYPQSYVYAATCLRGQCRIQHSSLWNCKSFTAYNYIHTCNNLTYTQVRFDNHTVNSLYMIHVTVIRVVGVLKMGNTVPRVGLKPTSLIFQVSVLPWDHIGSIISLLNPCNSLPHRSVPNITLSLDLIYKHYILYISATYLMVIGYLILLLMARVLGFNNAQYLSCISSQ